VKLNIPGTNTGAKVFSALFALVLWFHVATEQEYLDRVEIPIVYVEPSNGYMLSSTPPVTLQANVAGTGKSLLAFLARRLFDSEKSYVVVSLTGLPKGRHNITIDPSTVAIPKGENLLVKSILTNASFTVEIDRKVRQTVKVSLDSLPAYRLDEGLVLAGVCTADPAYIIIEGPEDMLSPITALPVSSLVPSVITAADTVVQGFFTSPSPFFTIEGQPVRIKLPVEQLLTKQFPGIKVTLADFPRRFRGTIIPDTVTVVIQGPASVIERSQKEQISVLVNYQAFQQLSGDSLITPVIRHPKGVTSAGTMPFSLRITTTPR
jgi:hypothetical protein